jgi:hypothetical protein
MTVHSLYDSFNLLSETLKTKQNTREYKRLKQLMSEDELQTLKKLQRKRSSEGRADDSLSDSCSVATNTCSVGTNTCSSPEVFDISDNEPGPSQQTDATGNNWVSTFHDQDYVLNAITMIRDHAKKELKRHPTDNDRQAHFDMISAVLTNTQRIFEAHIAPEEDDGDDVYETDWELTTKKKRRKKKRSQRTS